MTVAATPAPARRRVDPVSALPLGLFAELALAAVSLVSVLALRRVFIGTEWFPPLALQVLVAHGSATALRRRRVPTLPAVLLLLAAGVVVVAWIYAGDVTTFGVPTRITFEHLGSAVDEAMGAFADVKAPTDALDGFLVASSAAIWIGAALSDWAAFRVDATLEAILPSATLFVLAAVLGADIDRILLTGVWIACVFAFVLFRRAERLGVVATWVGERRSIGPRTMVLLGGALALAAVSVAALLGPRLPGASSEAIVSLTDIGDNGPGTRVTVSPLVDIRSRLVNQAEVEVFTVDSQVRDYWRLTSLDRFDGRIWSSNGSYGKADGDLDDGVPVAADRITFEQTFQIEALAQIWLPAAYEPQSIDTATPVRYDEVSGTLIVDTAIPTSDNVTYRVVSALPQLDAAMLAAASTEIPRSIAETYLALPGDFPAPVQNLAREVTAGATSAYQSARMLQDFFLANFDYDLDVEPGHGERAMERFLLEFRRGYCEQFAGSFAAMARSLGIPSRVAVGFTQGTADPAEPTRYRVRGANAHAWPEVYLGEYGWVKFEPTPGRGAPFTESYTGVPEQQPAPVGIPGSPPPETTPPSIDPSAAPPTSGLPQDGRTPDDLLGQETGGLGADSGPSPWPMRLAVTAVVLIALALLYLVLVLAVTIVRRSRRRRAAIEARDKIALAWDDSLRAIRRAGVRVRPADTPREVAERIGHRLPSLGAQLHNLSLAAQDVVYAPLPPDPEIGDEALALAGEIESAARATMSRPERFQTRFHPRQLLGGD